MKKSDATRRHDSPGDARAERHRRARRERSSELAQDYVETIADLIEASGEARATDLARILGVTHASVIRAVARLQRDGLVTTQPYRSIFLTDSGRRLARESKRRHGVVVDFLKALGVGPETAEADAEGIEHHVSPETLKAMQGFIAPKKGASSKDAGCRAEDRVHRSRKGS